MYSVEIFKRLKYLSGTIGDVESELTRLNKVYNRNYILIFVILFLTSWTGIVVSFMYVTGPLVFTHHYFFMNCIPSVFYIYYFVKNFPGKSNFLKQIEKNSA